MKQLIIFPLLLLGCAGSIPPNDCLTRPGLINGPIVDDQEEAVAIALAILPKNNWQNYDIITEEYQDYWAVSQVLKKDDRILDEDTIIVTTGGGGGSMKIAKCDGRIFDFHFMR
ncbi:MAG: hypothetical protein AAFW68_04430 [Pseudomonadota bacterium]